MTLFAIASRTIPRRISPSGTGAALALRSYSHQVDHFVSGWNVDEIEKFKTMDKYCIQTFNKISPIGLKFEGL